MYYIIQENLFREFHFNTLIEYLKRYELDYEIVKYIPFTEEIQFSTERRDIWCFGSPNMSAVAHKYGWNPGSLYNDNHDLVVQMPYFKKHLLNGDGWIISVEDKLPEKLPYGFFARPTKDTKQFSGQVFTHHSWYEWIENLENSNTKQNLSNETKVLVAPLKTTQQEIRCWIIDGEPVTMSQYKIGARVNYLNMDHNEEAYIFAKNMAKIYQPARAFVLDICLFNDDYKIVEINCINCSGFYDLNMSKLIQALENAFSPKDEHNRSIEIIDESFKERNY
jgi:hypothetical protein